MQFILLLHTNDAFDQAQGLLPYFTIKVQNLPLLRKWSHYSFIHSLSLTACPPKGRRELEPIPLVIGQEAGHALERSSVHNWDDIKINPFTPAGNLKSPINLTSMSLDCGRKPEGPREKILNGERRTCKLP